MPRTIVWAMTVLLLCSTTSAHAAAASGEASVEKVLAFYHAEQLLAASLDDVKAALAKRRKEITIADQRVAKIEQLAGRIYRPKNLMKVFKVAYSKSITLESMTAFYKWVNTVKGIKLRAALDAAHAASPSTRQAYFDKESPSILKPNRKNALMTYIQTSEQVAWYIRAKAGAELAIFKALNAYLSAGTRESDQALKEKADGRGEGHTEDAQMKAMVLDFYTFKDVKNAEIDEFTKFFASAVGQTNTKAILKALDTTMDRAASTLAAEIAKGNP